ncbi:MAG: hypothetical protein H7X95_08505 [Deltaproteobacteria bacterium]|nr:hypothetical protein [Deltaproteobacteria bacterium]
MKDARAPLHLPSSWRRLLVGVSAAAALFVGVMGFAHTSVGRPLLGSLGGLFGEDACPLGYDKLASPAEREKARLRFAASHRGPAPAAKRPALGFELDRTLNSEVVSVMAAKGITCRSATAMADLVCENVQGGGSSDSRSGDSHSGDSHSPRTVWFNFGATNRLVSVVALSRHPQAQPISKAFAGVIDTVTRQAGPPTNINGDGAADFLAAGALRQASAEFRFSDYFASARATNMGDNFLLTEEYRSLVN